MSNFNWDFHESVKAGLKDQLKKDFDAIDEKFRKADTLGDYANAVGDFVLQSYVKDPIYGVAYVESAVASAVVNFGKGIKDSVGRCKSNWVSDVRFNFLTKNYVCL